MQLAIRDKRTNKIIGYMIGKTSNAGKRYLVIQSKLYSKAKPTLLEINEQTESMYDVVKIG